MRRHVALGSVLGLVVSTLSVANSAHAAPPTPVEAAKNATRDRIEGMRLLVGFADPTRRDARAMVPRLRGGDAMLGLVGLGLRWGRALEIADGKIWSETLVSPKLHLGLGLGVTAHGKGLADYAALNYDPTHGYDAQPRSAARSAIPVIEVALGMTCALGMGLMGELGLNPKTLARDVARIVRRQPGKAPGERLETQIAPEELAGYKLGPVPLPTSMFLPLSAGYLAVGPNVKLGRSKAQPLPAAETVRGWSGQLDAAYRQLNAGDLDGAGRLVAEVERAFGQLVR